MEEHSWLKSAHSDAAVLNDRCQSAEHNTVPQPSKISKYKSAVRKSAPAGLKKAGLNASRKYAKAAVSNCSKMIVSCVSDSEAKVTFQSGCSRKSIQANEDLLKKSTTEQKTNYVEMVQTKISESENLIDSLRNHYTLSDGKSASKKRKVFRNQTATLSLDKARKKLSASHFRQLNEDLYTKTGDEAFDMFRTDPESFQVYHEGFKLQASKWPVNPLDVVIQHLSKMPDHLAIADFGCGEAQLAEQLQKKKVYSFDLVALKPCIIACNIAKVPLDSNMVDVAVFCLSLMGTDLSKYLLEANRVLKKGGSLLITEVASRFFSIAKFIKQVEQLGFHLNHRDYLGKMFLMLSFKKVTEATNSKVQICLKPCLYKRR